MLAEYKKILDAIRSYLRGEPFSGKEFLDKLKMIDDLVSDDCMEIPTKVNEKYSQLFTALFCTSPNLPDSGAETHLWKKLSCCRFWSNTCCTERCRDCLQTRSWTVLALQRQLSQAIHSFLHALNPSIILGTPLRPPNHTILRNLAVSEICPNSRNRTTGPEVLPSETPRIPLENAYFVRAANLLYILASHRTQTFPQNAFVFNVLRLPLQRFDYLTEGTVAQELEDLGQERLVWSFISSASVFHNFVHKPREKFFRAVIDRPVHYTNFQPVLEIPF